jgi:hypothetical protein
VSLACFTRVGATRRIFVVASIPPAYPSSGLCHRFNVNEREPVDLLQIDEKTLKLVIKLKQKMKGTTKIPYIKSCVTPEITVQLFKTQNFSENALK